MTIPTQFISYVNIAIIIFYMLSGFIGMKKGLVVQLLDFIRFICAVFFAWKLSPLLSSQYDVIPSSWKELPAMLLGESLPEVVNQMIWQAVCFIIAFILIQIIFSLLKAVFKEFSKFTIVKFVDSLFGGVLGVIVATCWLCAVSFILDFPVFTNGRFINDTTALRQIVHVATLLLQQVKV